MFRWSNFTKICSRIWNCLLGVACWFCPTRWTGHNHWWLGGHRWNSVSKSKTSSWFYFYFSASFWGGGVTFCLYYFLLLFHLWLFNECVRNFAIHIWFLATCFVERVGAEVVECACVIGVPDVKVIITY